MRLTQRTDLALRALIHLTAVYPDMATVSDMARSLDVSSHHLMKSVQDLRRAGFVESARGHAGGHRLHRAPQQISVGDVVRALEPVALVECFRDADGCVLTPGCTLSSALRNAAEAFLASLDGVSLCELAQPRTVALLQLRTRRAEVALR